MMKTIARIVILTSTVILMFIADVTYRPQWLPLGLQIVSDAHAVAGRARRTRRRGVAVGYSAGKSQSAAAEQEAAEAKAEAEAANQRADAAEAAAAAPAAGGALPLGTVVQALPAGCTKQTIGGVEYQYDGANYYRAAFQGNELVYVTSQP